jgi:hypothetical protein
MRRSLRTTSRGSMPIPGENLDDATAIGPDCPNRTTRCR